MKNAILTSLCGKLTLVILKRLAMMIHFQVQRFSVEVKMRIVVKRNCLRGGGKVHLHFVMDNKALK